MAKNNYFKIFGYGFLLFIATMVTIFLMSLISGTEDASKPPFDLWWLGLIAGVILAFVSYWFARLLKISTTRQALAHGLIWAFMLATILLVITVPNGTTKNFFGQWSIYFIFIGAAVGPVLIKNRSAETPKVTTIK